jgi:RNA polymerase sigma-70 factor (sigma-E family)
VDAADEEDFRAFVETRWQALVRVGFLLTGDSGRAEDLVQAALVQVHRHWRRIERVDGHDAYARRTLVNLNISWWRRRRVAEHLVDRVPERAHDEPDHAAAHADRDAVARALLTLPPRMRAVIVLRYYDDLSEADCAAALGCSIGTVKSQTSRGLDRLRVALDAPAAAPAPSTPATTPPPATFKRSAR